jgi:Transcriptional regulator, AbiEi antitoxin
MERKSAQPTLGELARRQWGVVTRAQLTELGVRDRGIADWVRRGRLQRLYRGVYAVGHDRLMREGRWLAAVLACGPGSVLSHRDAAVLWDLRQSNSAYIDVTVPSRNGRRRQAGIRVHRSGRLRRDEATVRNGIPVTTVARTLLDLADVLDRQALKRVITEAEYLNRFDLTALAAVVKANPGRRGAKLMARSKALAIGHVQSLRIDSSRCSSGTVSRSPRAASGLRTTRPISYGATRIWSSSLMASPLTAPPRR